MQKKYAIVRVDNKCPMDTERFSSFTCEDLFRCGYLWQLGQDTQCKDFCRYGDTKEQLERKIAQVLFRRKVKLYKKVWGCDMGSIEKEDQYKQCLKIAEEIVEFLGVEE